MEPQLESLSSDASDFKTRERSNRSSLKIDKPFSDFTLQDVKLRTFGNKFDEYKKARVKTSEPIKKCIEDSIEEDCFLQDSIPSEVQLEKSLKAFSERKEDNENNNEKFTKNSIEEDGFLQDSTPSEVQLEKSLKAFSERKEDNKNNNEKFTKDSIEEDGFLQDSTPSEVQLEKSLKAFSERKEDNKNNNEKNTSNQEEDEYLVFSWSSSDLGISRWNLPFRTTNLSNPIGDPCSIDFVFHTVHNVVKSFIDIRQLSPVIYSQRPPKPIQICNQQLESQEAGVSHQS